MIVSTTNSTIIKDSCVEYGLIKGGVIVCDKIGGIAKLVFEEGFLSEQDKSAYRVLINGKKLIFPTHFHSSEGRIVFTNSLKFIFEWKGEFIKITEKDAQSQSIFYVDPTKVIKDISYIAYSYMPKEINLEEAKQKFQNIKASFPNFRGDVAIYNRHGVAVFGFDRHILKHALYWANPHEKKVKPVELDEIDFGESFCVANATCGMVRFRSCDKGHFLNGERAIEIDLTSQNTATQSAPKSNVVSIEKRFDSMLIDSRLPKRKK